LSRRSLLATLAAFGLCLPASAQSTDYTGSITSIAPKAAMQGKLATRTEVIADRGEAAMITLGSAQALEGAIGMYEEIVAGGGWPMVPKGKYEKGSRGEKPFILRQRLIAEGYLDMQTIAGPSADMFDAELANAVRAFQVNHGIAPTGKIDGRTLAELNITAEARLFTLRENLPRVQEYMADLGPRYILVNIPSAQLETVEFGRIYSRHNVVVGKLDRPTPALKSTVSDVNFNPYWNAPASIVAKDLVPKYLKDPTIFEQMRIRIFDGVGGPEIDPASVDWVNTPPDRYHFRQEPGDGNALATVKVNFKNKFMVYMHDTPHRELFASNARYESSGCVRVDQVRTLIEWILNGQGGFDAGQFEMITASQEPYDVPVDNPPDVRFMYLTAWATEDGRVNFRPDVYRLDGRGFVLGQPDPTSSL
jgi:murein L,D-transpeptidase YcbB/YkuD